MSSLQFCYQSYKIKESGVVETLPTTNGTYTLKLTVSDGVNTFSWVLDS